MSCFTLAFLVLHGAGNLAEGYLTLSTVSLHLLIATLAFNTIYSFKVISFGHFCECSWSNG